MNRAWISLGANLGDAKRNLEKALRLLQDDKEIFLEAHSSFYKTQALDFSDQPDFINLCARIRTVKTPEALLQRFFSIQEELGQGKKEIPFGPRFMDLDLLLYEDEIIDSGFLVLPHPRMHLRRFVLKPLCELNPERIHPVSGLTMLELLQNIPEETQKVERIP